MQQICLNQPYRRVMCIVLVQLHWMNLISSFIPILPLNVDLSPLSLKNPQKLEAIEILQASVPTYKFTPPRVYPTGGR